MKKTQLSLLLFVLSVMLGYGGIFAQTVSRTIIIDEAGQLSTLLGSDKNTVTDLSLKGTMNDADFATIRNMAVLESLNIKEVNLPNAALPYYAFQNCNLDIQLPLNIKSIGVYAFRNAKLKSKITMPITLEVIDWEAFVNMDMRMIDLEGAKGSLKAIGGSAFAGATFENNILDLSEFTKLTPGRGSFLGLDPNITIVLPKHLTQIPEYTFDGISGHFIIPDNITHIGTYAFRNAKLKSKITMPITLEVIDWEAFVNMDMRMIDLEGAKGSLKAIGGSAFAGATFENNILDLSEFTKLTPGRGSFLGLNPNMTIVLPKHLTQIPEYTFDGISGHFIIPDNITHIGTYAFRNAKPKNKIVLPKGFKTIAWEAFVNMDMSMIDLDEAKESLQVIGGSAFAGAKFENNILDLSDFSKLTEMRGAFKGMNPDMTIILPKNLTELESYIFDQSSGHLVIPGKITKIGTYAFRNATLKSRIVLPNTLKTIDWEAFRGATVPEIISYNPVPPTLGNNTFFGMNTTSCILYVPPQSVDVYKNTAQWNAFSQILPIEPFIQIQVLDANTNEDLSTGTYEVTQNGQVLGVYRGGDFVINIAYGSYIITEKESPERYQAATPNSYEVTISESNKNQIVVFKNQLIADGNGTLIINNKDVLGGHQLFFAEYEVYDENNIRVGRGKIETDNIVNASLVVKPIELALNFGTYTIKETKTPSNDYQLSDPMRVAFVRDNQEATILSRTKDDASLIVNFLDEDNKQPLSTGKYIVVNWMNDTILPPTQPVNGKITLPKLSYGWYIVREVATPSGYIPYKYRGHQIELSTGQKDQVIEIANKRGTLTSPSYEGSVNIEFKTNGILGETSQKMKGIKVGEYLWSNEHLKTNNLVEFVGNYEAAQGLQQISENQVDKAHQLMAMFNYHRRPDTPNLLQRPTFWSYGVSIEDVNNNYGGVFNQAYFTDWHDPNGGEGPGKHRLSDVNGLRKIVMHANVNYRPVYLYMYENGLENYNWRIPMSQDLRQLVGMCGEGSMRELRQYLSWAHDDPNAPSIVKATNSISLSGTPAYMNNNYFDWFEKSVSDVNSNKYGFNLTPTGWRLQGGSTVKEYAHYNDESKFSQQLYQGDFITLNQVFRLRAADYACLEIGDQTNLYYGEDDFAQYPIRFCRPMTDEELGYKLWINTYFNDEEKFMKDLATNVINPTSINIIKTEVNNTPAGTWYELPRGYTRGAYVQFILNNPSPSKTILDILKLGYITHERKNINGLEQGLWKNPFISFRNTLETSDLHEKVTKTIVIYPNPVIDILNIRGHEAVDYLELFDVTGNLVIKTREVESFLDMSILSEGVYILKLQTNTQIFTYKVVKK